MSYVSNLKTVQGFMDDWQRRALETIGQYVRGEAVLRCPVDTGNLRSSIDYRVLVGELAVQIGSPVDYGIYIEKGTGIYAENGQGRQTPWFYVDDDGEGHFTHGMKPQPFLTPAVEDNINQLEKIVRGVRFG